VSTELTFDAAEVLAFCRQRIPVVYIEGMQGIGLKREGELIAGVLYEGFNGQSVWMHVAAMPGKRWMTRDYLRACFQYPFLQLGVESVFGWVTADNEEAQRFDEHLGFTVDAVLKGAGPHGVDVLLYRMRRDQCRFL